MRNKKQKKTFEVKVQYRSPKGNEMLTYLRREGLNEGQVYLDVIHYLVKTAKRRIHRDLRITMYEREF